MITMISGYPGSGKSTLAKRLAREHGGAALDLDEIANLITGGTIHDARPDIRATLGVNACMWQLADALAAQGLDVFIIRHAPGVAEWEAHAKYCARIHVDTPKDVCRARAEKRGDFDAERFERACARVDEFLTLYGGKLRHVPGTAADR